MKVGTIKEIWRYPVKGMAGERLDGCPVSEKGLQGDRTWAMRDAQRKEIQSCKFRPDLLRCTARANGSNLVDVTFPDGMVLRSDDRTIHAKLSALTGHESTLEPLRPDADTEFYRRFKPERGTWLDELSATFEREPGEPLPDFSQIPPILVDHVSVPGTFFLVTPMHLVTTATLRHLQSRNAGGNWDRRRFRPNLVIETEGPIEGLAEQSWVGRKIVIGDMAIDCVGGTPRCAAVTRAQSSFGFDKTILRTIVKEADQNVGVYGLIANGGNIREGDAVFVD